MEITSFPWRYHTRTQRTSYHGTRTLSQSDCGVAREGAQRQAAADATADNRDDELASSDGGGAASSEGQGEHTEDASEQSSADVCDSTSHSSNSSESEADEADASEEDPPDQTHDASDPGKPVEEAASGLDMSRCHPCGSSSMVTSSLLWYGWIKLLRYPFAYFGLLSLIFLT